MTADGRGLFAFAQVEVPWQLGPEDGRYVVRPDGEPDAQVTQVIVLATLGAPQRRRIGARRPRGVDPEPEPTAVTTGRATVVFSAEPLRDRAAAQAWLRAAGEDQLTAGLLALNRMLSAFRRVAADPYAVTVGRHQLITARIGYGAGEQVADGQWEQARELPRPDRSRRRARVLAPQARLAAALGARQTTLVCEELALRARLDLDQDRPREATLQLLVTLDAAVAELGREPPILGLSERVAELRERRAAVASAAQTALGAVPSIEQLELVRSTVERIEAALRARAIALSRDPAPGGSVPSRGPAPR
jgi:hypothetical protein